ncbi:MAG TPA: RNA polymerase sigma-70 factor [Chitinophagaceae bacterium]
MRPAKNIDEQVLKAIAEKIAAGDQPAFRLLFDYFAARLTEFARAILKSKEAATEVVDDVLVKVWKNRETLPLVGNIRVYLYTATKNTALNYLSCRAREVITEPFDHISIQLQDDQSPEQQMITEEILRKIHTAVDDLPPRCKMIFKLVREDGLKYKEVAEILKISVNTVDAQMVIAVKKISEAVKGYFNRVPGLTLKKSKNFS